LACSNSGLDRSLGGTSGAARQFTSIAEIGVDPREEHGKLVALPGQGRVFEHRGGGAMRFILGTKTTTLDCSSRDVGASGQPRNR